MFRDHQNYMRLHTDEEIESLDEITLIDMLKKKKDFSLEKSISLTKSDLQNLLKNMREQDTLCSGMMVLVSQTTVIL